MLTSKETTKLLAKEALLSPQEETLEIRRRKQNLFIGVPKEISMQENRVALTPDAVTLLVNNGHQIRVQKDAGKKANFTDNDYSEAGAEICSLSEVFKADFIVKVEPPVDREIELMFPGQTLMSALQLTVHPKETLKKLIQKKITALAWDFIKDEEGTYPVVRIMSEIAGNTAILIAAEHLSNTNDGLGVMLGGIAGIPSSEVVIIGAGTVGEYAARAAIGLGATVKVFDNSISRLRRIQSKLGQRVYTSIMAPTTLSECLQTADVAIGALRTPKRRTPVIVTEEMVQGMKSGSVIVDVSIDRGGCFETSRITTHNDPIYKVHDVVHYCVPNIASRVSRTASYALSQIFAPLLLEMGEMGGVSSLIKINPGFRNGTYIYKGILTNQLLGEAFDLRYKDIELLVAGL
ncbi:MAG: alanine dehydrogenase [Patiriisocius sp.]|jgi:alanine dehydrogenase